VNLIRRDHEELIMQLPPADYPKPENHICCVYYNEEEHRKMSSFLVRHGLKRGEKVFFTVDAHSPETVLEHLREGGLFVDRFLASGQLVFWHCADIGMIHGIFAPNTMLAWIKESTEQSLIEGYPGLCVIGEMAWASGSSSGFEQLIEYEARLNELCNSSKCLVICRYDRCRLNSDAYLHILRMHSRVMIGAEPGDKSSCIKPATGLPGQDLGIHVTKLESTLHRLTELRQAAAKRILLEKRMRQIQKMETAHTFAGGIALTFDNILGIIRSNAQLAMQCEPSASTVCKHMKEILSASERARDTLHQITLLTSERCYERGLFRLNRIIGEVLNCFESTLPFNIRLHKSIEAKMDWIRADRTQIYRAFTNICKNAVDAMHKEGGRLEVATSDVCLDCTAVALFPGMSPGSYVEVSVKDTGHGVDGTMMERIFDPYFTTRDSVEGTGLGLAIAQGIIHGHGGIITVESEPGKGTAVHVFLPVSSEQ